MVGGQEADSALPQQEAQEDARAEAQDGHGEPQAGHRAGRVGHPQEPSRPAVGTQAPARQDPAVRTPVGRGRR